MEFMLVEMERRGRSGAILYLGVVPFWNFLSS